MVMLNTEELFQTVPKKDYLELFHNRQVDSKVVIDFLNFKTNDVARASGIPVASIRYDNKMPEILKERLNEWATLLNLVAGHFQGNRDKTTQWFTMANPLLGNVSPRDMIRAGRFKKLLSFILTALSENKR